MEQEIGIWDSVLLDNLTEENFINLIQQRYEKDFIYTHIGTSIVAVNPYRHVAEDSSGTIHHYTSKGIFQLPPHIYGIANLAFQSLKDQCQNQCIFLTGESGSGKTESFKMIVNFLTNIQEVIKRPKIEKQSSISGANCTRHTSTASHHRRAISSTYCTTSTSVSKIASEMQRRSLSPGPVQTRPGSSSSAATNSIQHQQHPHTTRIRADSSDRQRTSSLSEATIGVNNYLHKSSEHIPMLNNMMHSASNINRCRSREKNRPPFHAPNAKSSKTCHRHQLQQYPNNSHHHAAFHSGCNHCGHSRCNRSQSLEKDDKDLGTLGHTKVSFCESFTNLVKPFASEAIRTGSCTPQKSFYYAGLNSQKQKTSRVSSTPSYTSSLHEIPNYKGTSPKSLRQKLRECVTCADVFLEAMGNATTQKNNNSSRYGKLFDVEIDFKGDLMGVHITQYMLEKSRVTNIPAGERNFHIFYQLLLGADLQFLKSLKLYRNIEKYELLGNTNGLDEDRLNFHYTKKSLDILGLSNTEISNIFRIIAVVLKLGNLIYVPITNIDGTEGCQIANIYEVEEIADLLCLNVDLLIDCLTKSNASEESGCELDARQASNIRGVLCRTFYGRLFTWLANKVNEIMKSTQRERNLALLDFYGFEVLERNYFEQFIINYSAEKIHQNFIQTVLRGEQELYIKDGLEWQRIDYFDNDSICQLIDKPNYGILSLINEQHLHSNEALLLRIQQCCSGHPNFMTSPQNSMSFKICHYANVVSYSIQSFLEKNSDNLPKNVSLTLYKSNLSLIQNLFPEGNPRKLGKKEPTTLSATVRTQLHTLLDIVKNRRSHYVFCIKPNECKLTRNFDISLVQHQVRYMSLLPLARLCRSGHCFHLTHVKFFQRYKFLNLLTWPHFENANIIEGIALIIRDLPLPSAEFTIGTKNVFMRSPRTVYELESFRHVRLNELAILIQKTFRMYKARKTFLQLRRCQIIISTTFRRWRKYSLAKPFGRTNFWHFYKVATKEHTSMKYRKRALWAVEVISNYYRNWKKRQFLLTIPMRLPPNTLSPLSMDWPVAPKFIQETSHLLRSIYHRWKCHVYRLTFDQTSRNRMREKVTASIIFKERKASYLKSIAHPFIGDYIRLRQNAHWKRICMETHDQYVVFADIIHKVARSSGKLVPILLVISTSALLLLDQRTLQIKYRVPAAEIYRISLSPYMDDFAVFHVKASEVGRKKGDFVLQTAHIIEIVTKMFLVIQNATNKPPEIHINTEFEANFGQQAVMLAFKVGGMFDPSQNHRVIRKTNKMEIHVFH